MAAKWDIGCLPGEDMKLQGDTSGCDKALVDWPGQNGTFVLMSTGGSSQPDVSPCTLGTGEPHFGIFASV